MTRRPDTLPIEIPLLSLHCAVCRATPTRAGSIVIYPVPLCDACTLPVQPTARLIHVARVFDGNRAAEDKWNTRGVLLEMGAILAAEGQL